MQARGLDVLRKTIPRAALLAVLTVAAAAPALAQNAPQNAIIVDGTNYGSMFSPAFASEEELALASLKAAVASCNKIDYDVASSELQLVYIQARRSLDSFNDRFGSGGQKVRTTVYGGGAVIERQKMRLQHDADLALQIYNARPPFKCAPPPPQPQVPGPPPAPPVSPPPALPPMIAEAQGTADAAQKVLDLFTQCIPPALAKSWISLLEAEDLKVVRYSVAHHQVLDYDPLETRLTALSKAFRSRICPPPGEAAPQSPGGIRVGLGETPRTVRFTGSFDLGGAFRGYNATGFGSFGTVDYVSGGNGLGFAYGGDIRATLPVTNRFDFSIGVWGKGLGGWTATDVNLDPFVPGRESTLAVRRDGFLFPYVGVTYDYSLPIFPAASVTLGVGPRFEHQTRTISIVQAGLMPTYEFSSWVTAPTLFLDTDVQFAKISPSTSLTGRLGLAVDFQPKIDYDFTTPLGIANGIELRQKPDVRFYVGIGLTFDTGTPSPLLLDAP